MDLGQRKCEGGDVAEEEKLDVDEQFGFDRNLEP